MLVNRPALHLTDAAAMHLGATCFSIYNTSSPEQIEYLIEDAANRVIVTEVQFLESVLAARERVKTLEHVVVVDGSGKIEGTITIEELDAMGAEDFDFEAAWRAVEPEDVLCLIYTSGTTGPPKGVQLTHGNMVSQWRACDGVHEARPAGGRSRSCRPPTSPTAGPRSTRRCSTPPASTAAPTCARWSPTRSWSNRPPGAACRGSGKN